MRDAAVARFKNSQPDNTVGNPGEIMKTDERFEYRDLQKRPRAISNWLAAVIVIAATLALPHAQAQTFDLLYSFPGVDGGAYPSGTLIRDAEGNFYGTTSSGGPNHMHCYGGCGVIFKLDSAGAESVLYSFEGRANGSGPAGSVVRDSQGNLYGITSGGGINSCNGGNGGCGLVFEIGSDGDENTLFSFENLNQGRTAVAGLVRDDRGNLYGTTQFGGRSNNGTVFKVDANGNFTELYAFSGGADGGRPFAAMTLDAQGNLYGTATTGGLNNCNGSGCGVVFKIDPAGNESVIYAFTGSTDGSFPASTLVADSAGNFYGTTEDGGDNSCNAPYGCGVAFKLNRAGAETVLYTFHGGTGDGRNPVAGVVRDLGGNLYGTTYWGGAYGLGTVYEVTASGGETILHSFEGGSNDGSYPWAGLALDSAGVLYGVTVNGGGSGCAGFGCGVIFKVAP